MLIMSPLDIASLSMANTATEFTGKVVCWPYGILGSNIRKPLPSCVAIGRQLPEDGGTCKHFERPHYDGINKINHNHKVGIII